jgi:hypothetical protein
MACESLIVGEMMIGGEEGNDTLWMIAGAVPRLQGWISIPEGGAAAT